MPFYTLSQDLIVIEIPCKWHFKGNFYGYLTIESPEDPGPPGPPINSSLLDSSLLSNLIRYKYQYSR